jgi:hypothetical protein
VGELAGILFQVDAADAYPPLFPRLQLDVKPAIRRQRQLELADLVRLGQVRVEVVLAGEDVMALYCTVQLRARATRMANSTARRLITGSMPGIPRQTGQTAEFGAAAVLSTTRQPQNIFELVSNSAWISRPMTGSCSPICFTI